MSYCIVPDVEALAQPGGTSGGAFSALTRPTLVQVQAFIDKISNHMDIRILSAGYTLPITGAKALSYLALVNSWGAAALAEHAISGRENEKPSGVAVDLWNKYTAALKEIETTAGILDPDPSAVSVPKSLWTSRVVDGSDENYSDEGPWFRRDTTF